MNEATPPTEGSSDAVSEPQRVWLRLRQVFGAPRPRRQPPKPKGDSMPYGRGRDPLAAGAVLDSVTDSLGWRTPLAQTDLTAAWRSIAGEETSRHASVEGFADGVLLVRCDSTAWATQLGLMRAQIAERIATDFPEAGVDSIRFLGPNTPSWNHGRRSVPGRGPRDTYG
jgi:predicted nucleic acid-binding Zn ribbon protein